MVENIYSHDKKDTNPHNISPIEIGVIWAKITYVKSHSKALDFNPQTDMKEVFQMRY